MENIKYGLFDLFAYAIPGSLIIIICYIVNQFNICDNTFEITSLLDIDIKLIIFVTFVVLSYATGYTSSILGDLLLIIVEKIFKQPKPKHTSELNNSTKYALLRELSPQNFRYVEQWNVLKKMTSNLSFVILFLNIYLLICMECYKWYYFFFGLVIFVILISKTWKYHNWAIIDLDNAIHIFDLQNKKNDLLKNKLLKND